MRDWRSPLDYGFTAGLNGAQWAWEFLRRHPEYRREWQEFIAVWTSLEAVYGSPPDRNFCAWQRDPRAYVRVTDETAGDCRVDQDKVLIECAFGARWGFHKFPPDPADDDPVGGERLTWRPLERRMTLLGPEDGACLGGDMDWAAVGFDLRMPLADQLHQAKRLLQRLQRERVKQGQVRRYTLANYATHWQLLLRLLDAEASGADEERIRAGLGDIRIAGLREDAEKLLNGGYRELAFLQ